jgi:hypothetical protein
MKLAFLLVALPLLATAAHAGDVRFKFHGTVSTASNPNGAYVGVAVGDPVEMRCEVFTIAPPPVVISPNQYVNYVVDTATLTMTLGSVNVAYTSGSPVVGMVNAFPVSDGVQGPSCSVGSKNLGYSINHNSGLWTSVDPLTQLGTHPIVVDGSFSFSWAIQGGGMLIEVFPSDIVVELVETGTPFCFGDGAGMTCPCGNNSAVGANAGCLHSLGSAGTLRGTGLASIANDSLTLRGTLMPNSSALYFQGTTQLNGGNGIAFGDGLRCAAGSVIRLGTKTNVSGASQYPVAGDPSVSVRGGVVAPATHHYQVWYRNAATFCTSSTFNLTNGLTIVWGA